MRVLFVACVISAVVAATEAASPLNVSGPPSVTKIPLIQDVVLQLPEPDCTYCWDGIYFSGGAWHAWLEVEGYCYFPFEWEGWCATCTALPYAPNFECSDFEDWGNGPFGTAAAAQNWLDENGCYSMRCQLEGEAFVHLIGEMIDNRNYAALARVMEDEPDRVWLNQDRSAIQANGCDDTVALHVPISHAALTELRHAIQPGGAH